MATGWIKDFRKEIESDIWLMPPLYHRVWQYIKYKVNHEEKMIPMNDGNSFKIVPGQHLTSIRTIAKGVGWYEGLKWKEPNPKTIKSILDWMIVKNMVQVDGGRGNRQYTLITIVKWESYQLESNEGNSKVTVNGEARKQSADINKNDKNDYKNEKKYIRGEENVQCTVNPRNNKPWEIRSERDKNFYVDEFPDP